LKTMVFLKGVGIGMGVGAAAGALAGMAMAPRKKKTGSVVSRALKAAGDLAENISEAVGL